MVAATDHSLLELRTIFRDNVFDAFFALEVSCHFKSLCNNCIGAEVSHSSLEHRVLTADFNYIIDETRV